MGLVLVASAQRCCCSPWSLDLPPLSCQSRWPNKQREKGVGIKQRSGLGLGKPFKRWLSLGAASWSVPAFPPALGAGCLWFWVLAQQGERSRGGIGIVHFLGAPWLCCSSLYPKCQWGLRRERAELGLDSCLSSPVSAAALAVCQRHGPGKSLGWLEMGIYWVFLICTAPLTALPSTHSCCADMRQDVLMW